MARPSSTSNSDAAATAVAQLPPGVPREGGFPWALAMALLIVVVVEIVVRCVEPSRLIPYVSTRLEYEAVRSYVDAYGPADVSFVGDSRTRAGILVTDVAKAGIAAHGLTVANYGLSAANLPIIDLETRYLLKQPRRPKLIVYGVSPHHLYFTGKEVNKLSLLWDLRDWWHAGGIRNWQTRHALPVVARWYIGRAWRTFEYREWPSLAIGRRWWGDQSHCVITGELTLAHQREPNLSIVDRPVTAEWSEWFFRGWRKDRVIPPGTTEQLRAMLDACKAAGVDVVMYEMPAAGILKERINPLYDTYIAATKRVAAEAGVPFLTLADLNLTMTDREFAEYSHLNYPGAQMVTRALIEHVVAPRMAMLTNTVGSPAPTRAQATAAAVDTDKQRQ